MEKVINQFHFNIYKLMAEYSYAEPTPYNKCLLAKLNYLLKEYNSKEWLPIQKYYEIYENSFFTIEERIIFLLILNNLKERIDNYDFSIIRDIILSFAYSEINAYHFDAYLDFLLNEKMYSRLSALYNFNQQILPLQIILKRIFEMYYLSQINKAEEQEIYDILDKMIYPTPNLILKKE